MVYGVYFDVQSRRRLSPFGKHAFPLPFRRQHGGCDGESKVWNFYLSCGLIAALAQGLADPDSPIPMVGASGAISGIMAGYLLLYPRANVRFFYWIFIFIGTVYLPAYLLLGFWLIEQAIALPESMQQAGGVAIAAHLGGFGAGLALTPFFKRPGVRMFQSGYSRPFSRNFQKMR